MAWGFESLLGHMESWQNGYCTGLENQRPLDIWVRIPGSPYCTGSQMVRQRTANPLIVGSNPTLCS